MSATVARISASFCFSPWADASSYHRHRRKRTENWLLIGKWRSVLGGLIVLRKAMKLLAKVKMLQSCKSILEGSMRIMRVDSLLSSCTRQARISILFWEQEIAKYILI
jgi:hypothetical protein